MNTEEAKLMEKEKFIQWLKENNISSDQDYESRLKKGEGTVRNIEEHFEADSISVKLKKTSEKLLSENNLLPLQQLNEGYTRFEQKFNPEMLKGLDGELLIETIFNIGNRDGMTYWLEFKNDDEFKTNANSYGSIAGGSAFKFIMFKRNIDGKWVTGNPQNPTILSTEEAVALGRDLRDALIGGSEIIDKLSVKADILDYTDLQQQLESVLTNNMYNLGWVHKYYHMLYPNKIDSFHSTKWQKHALISCGVIPEQEDKLYTMSRQLMQIINEIDLPSSYAAISMNELFGPPINYFRIGTGDGENRYWESMRTNSYVGIGWSKLGDLNVSFAEDTMRKDIPEVLTEQYQYNSSVSSRKAGEIIRFYNRIKIGDIVVAARGEKILGIGRVSGDYEYVEDRPYPHCKNVEWIKIFKEPIGLPNASAGKLTTCFRYKDIENTFAIESLIREKNNVDDTPLEVSLSPLTGTVADIENTLKRKKQVILYGPPGTGKTYYAEKACFEISARSLFRKSFSVLTPIEKEEILGDGRTNGTVRMCCFHPSYGYEDFIEGIKPRVINQQTVFEPKDGIFKELCKDAIGNPDKKYYLIIDEINRGDISRIFGELIMLIEAGKRGKSIILSLTNTSFSVPGNVYIVGTMNTADRSIALLDVALRRRFGFIELMTDYSLFEKSVFEGLPLAGWLKELNGRIREHIGNEARNLQIGHSYFLEKEKVMMDNEKFKWIIKEDIIPLIEEYCYGDYSLIAKILGEGVVDVKNQMIKPELFGSSDISDLVTALLAQSPTLRVEVESVEDSQEDDGVEGEE